MAAEKYEKKGLSANWAVHEVDHLFGKLAAYTRFVFFGKWFLVGIALVLLATLIGLPLMTHDRSGIRVSFMDTGSATKAASSPVMNNPEYLGSDEKGQQFKVNGLRATQVTPTLVHIDRVEGQLLMSNGGWKSLTSDSADYQQDTKIIELIGNVNVLDDQGYDFTSQQATVDANTMDITGHEPVTGVGPLGNLLASSFEIRDSGKHITFLGGAQQVHVHIDRAQKTKK